MRPLLKAFGRSLKGTALFLGLILYGWGVASTHAVDNSATEIIAEWDFGGKEDVHQDGWPDAWTRRTGRDYPKFVPVAIYQNAGSKEELTEMEILPIFSSQCYLAWQQGK